MKALLRSPLHWPLSRYFMLLSWTGRKSGRSYTTPVSYVRDGDRLFVTTGDRWWRNVVGGGPVMVRLAGRRRAAVATPLTDRAECVAEHQRVFAERPFFRRLAGLPSFPGGGADPNAVRNSVDAGRMLVRIDLDSGS